MAAFAKHRLSGCERTCFCVLCIGRMVVLWVCCHIYVQSYHASKHDDSEPLLLLVYAVFNTRLLMIWVSGSTLMIMRC